MARLGRRNSALSTVVAALIALAGWWISQHGGASTPSHHPSGPSYSQHDNGGEQHSSGTVALSSLPREAADTVALIDKGGPFPYPDHDDKTFHNSDGLLPAHDDGYYREYTVITPGSSDRGARRIIKGEDGTLYWTADHYESFAVISR
ncbi:guanyl-specific ribonuclease [Nocardioides montaniterrae]